MAESWTYLIIFFVVTYSVRVLAGKTGLVLETRLWNFYQCPQNKNTSLIITESTVKRISSSESRLYGKLTIQEDVNDMVGKLELFKCASKSEPDTCEYQTAIKYTSLCDYINNQKDPWFGYFNSTTIPGPRCPLAKGNWLMTGIKIGLTKSFPLYSGFWRLRNRAWDPQQKKMVACFITEMTIISRFKII